ncbi:MAG: hypothetical protein Q7U47_15745 [Paludibacter sp.]|nr:hypothetical protein [Paludibacter sp.]
MHYYHIKIFLTIFLAAFLFHACEVPADGMYKKITLERKSSMPGTGRASAVAFAINGKGYVTLGRTLKKTDLWEYNPITDTWKEKKPFPGINRVKGIAAVVNNKAYVGLGFGGGAVIKSIFFTDFWSYDPLTDKWESLAGYPGKATDACVSFVIGTKIYVGAGYKHLTMDNAFWAYNTLNNAWEPLQPTPGEKRFGAVACSDGNKAFFGTGFRAINENDWWEYFPATDTWKQMKSMPDKGRVQGIALSVSNRFFVTTGRYFNGKLNGGKVLSDIYEYDPVTNRWYNRGGIPDGGRENAVSFVIDKKAYIGFGENDTTVLNDFWSFEP